MAPALVITLMILGWSAAAVAMLWGILRTARYHHRHATRRHRLGEPPVSAQRADESTRQLPLQEYSA